MQLVDRKTCGWQQQCKLLGQRAGRQVAHEHPTRFRFGLGGRKVRLLSPFTGPFRSGLAHAA